MKHLLGLLAFLPAVALATPQAVKIQDALAMRDAITGILKGHVVVTPVAKDAQPVVTVEPFDIGTGALLSLGHDKHALNDALADFDSTKSDILTAKGITGRADDTHAAVAMVNADIAAYVKAHPTVTVDLEPISLDDLQISKNKLDNDAVFGVLGAILKTK
jgi:hypothetical protein